MRGAEREAVARQVEAAVQTCQQQAALIVMRAAIAKAKATGSACPPCNQNCDQGRTCPARVARVGRRMHAAEPLPPPTWRDGLKDASLGVLLTIAAFFISGLAVIAASMKT